MVIHTLIQLYYFVPATYKTFSFQPFENQPYVVFIRLNSVCVVLVSSSINLLDDDPRGRGPQLHSLLVKRVFTHVGGRMHNALA